MSDWQPIETAPKDGEPYPFFILLNDRWGVFIGWWSDGWFGMGETDATQRHPTHWMQLPAPPPPAPFTGISG